MSNRFKRINLFFVVIEVIDNVLDAFLVLNVPANIRRGVFCSFCFWWLGGWVYLDGLLG